MALPNPHDLAGVHAWLTTHRTDPAAVAAWAAPTLDAGRLAGPLPALGDMSWLALPNHDPRKLAAALVAALAHIADRTPMAVSTRVRAELDEFATAVRRAFTDAEDDVRQARVRLGYSTGPTHAVLVRRRATYRCWPCGANVIGRNSCPVCGWAGTPEQIHTRASNSWADTSRGETAA